MGYNHAMAFTAAIRKGVTVAEVEQALKPLFDSFGYPQDAIQSKSYSKFADHVFTFNPDESEELDVYTGG